MWCLLHNIDRDVKPSVAIVTMTSQLPPSQNNPEEGGQKPPPHTSPKSKMMKFFRKKLKSRLALIIGFLVAIVIVVVFTVAIYFATNNSDDSTAEGTKAAPETSDEVTGEKQTVPSTSRYSTTRLPTLTPTTSLSASSKPPLKNLTTFRPTTKAPLQNLTSTQNLTTSRPTAKTPSQILTSTQNLTTSGLTTKTTSALPHPSTVENSSPNVSKVQMEDVHVYIENKTLELTCNVRHLGSWRTLTIKRIFGDALEPVVLAVHESNESIVVHVLHNNASHEISMDMHSVSLRTMIDNFHCNDVSNYSCVLETDNGLVTGGATVSMYLEEPPTISVPHVVVEEREVMLHCKADTLGTNATIKWQFKSPSMDTFMDFGGTPVVERIEKNCTTTITSNLTFSPTMYENGSDFRCLLYGMPGYVRQTRHVDTKLLVVQKDFCEGKHQFTVHAHPYRPCSLVIYCLETGPLVYEIECEPGQCYDATRTTCVPADEES